MVTHPRVRAFLIGVLFTTLHAAPLDSAHAKFALIERDRALPGSRITLTAAELTAYAREQAEIIAPGAVTGATLTLAPGRAEASAMIDFLHLPQVGSQPGWLVRKLLEGQRPLRLRVRIVSLKGQARVDVEYVEIAGVTVEGRTLDFLLSQFVIPSFPEARTGKWFELSHNIDRIEVVAGRVYVTISDGTTLR